MKCSKLPEENNGDNQNEENSNLECSAEPSKDEVSVKNHGLYTEWICEDNKTCTLNKSKGCKGDAKCVNGVWVGSGTCKKKRMCSEKPGSELKSTIQVPN